MNRLGRRVLLVASEVIMCACLVAIGVYFYLKSKVSNIKSLCQCKYEILWYHWWSQVDPGSSDTPEGEVWSFIWKKQNISNIHSSFFAVCHQRDRWGHCHGALGCRSPVHGRWRGKLLEIPVSSKTVIRNQTYRRSVDPLCCFSGFSIGLGPIPWVINAELFPKEAKVTLWQIQWPWLT